MENKMKKDKEKNEKMRLRHVQSQNDEGCAARHPPLRIQEAIKAPNPLSVISQ